MNQPNRQNRQQKNNPNTAETTSISKNVNNVAATLRILEERYSNLRNKSQISEQNIIEIEKDVTGDMKIISDEILDLKHDIKDLKEKIMLITGELKNLVNKDEFKILDRYVDMWQPMHFVTRNELEKHLNTIRKK